MKACDCLCHVTLRLTCVPAKYSMPGLPNSAGEQLNVCHTKWLMPSTKASSALRLSVAGHWFQW